MLQQAFAEEAESQRAALHFGRSGLGAAFEYAEQPELAERSTDPYTEKNRGRTLEDKEEGAAQNRNLNKDDGFLAPLHFLQSDSPDCEDESLYADAAAEMCAGMSASHCVLDSKRVPLAPLQQSSSINQGWVSWRDSSGDIVMAEKQRSSGSFAKDEISDASASDAQKDESDEDCVTITGACLCPYGVLPRALHSCLCVVLCVCVRARVRARFCPLFLCSCTDVFSLSFFDFSSFHRMLQGVTRVDDPVESIDLCQDEEAAAAAAGMIPVL
jgi:hypothetical protein